MFLVRHAPTVSDFDGKGDPNKITDKSRKIADLRARRFLDVPVRQIATSPTPRAKLMADSIHKYTGASVRESWDLSPWYMGPLTSKVCTQAEKNLIWQHMTTKKAEPIPGGTSYLLFLSMLLPYIRSVEGEDELVCVTHRSNIGAIMAWDAAGRGGLSQDTETLKNFDAIDKIQILELTPDSCIPLVVEEMDSVT